MMGTFLKGGLALIVALLAVATFGCNTGPALHELTGTVTFEGQPVQQGEIIYESSSVWASPITDGKFTVQVPSGKHKVKITATREEGKAADGLPNYVSYIPKKYNEQTTLEEDVSGKKEVKYELTK